MNLSAEPRVILTNSETELFLKHWFKNQVMWLAKDMCVMVSLHPGGQMRDERLQDRKSKLSGSLIFFFTKKLNKDH